MLRVLLFPFYLTILIVQVFLSILGIELKGYKIGTPKFTFKYYCKIACVMRDFIVLTFSSIFFLYYFCIITPFYLLNFIVSVFLSCLGIELKGHKIGTPKFTFNYYCKFWNFIDNNEIILIYLISICVGIAVLYATFSSMPNIINKERTEQLKRIQNALNLAKKEARTKTILSSPLLKARLKTLLQYNINNETFYTVSFITKKDDQIYRLRLDISGEEDLSKFILLRTLYAEGKKKILFRQIPEFRKKRTGIIEAKYLEPIK